MTQKYCRTCLAVNDIGKTSQNASDVQISSVQALSTISFTCTAGCSLSAGLARVAVRLTNPSWQHELDPGQLDSYIAILFEQLCVRN